RVLEGGRRAAQRHRLLATLGALLLLLAAPGRASVRAAQDAPSPDWEQTALTEKAVRLFTPMSGAFFAQTVDAFFRSDDGGETWQHVPLPPGATILDVDPTN